MSGSHLHLQPWTSDLHLAVLGTGSAFPDVPITTKALIDTVMERFSIGLHRQATAIGKKLAINERYVSRPFLRRDEPARKGQNNVDLAAEAVKAALDNAGLQVGDIGYLIGHTTTPLQPLPSNIALVADSLGYGGPHIELRQACTGFANALMIANGLLQNDGARPVMIVGSETGSLFFDPEQMNTDPGQIVNMVQMGDGAGAIILGPLQSKGASIHSSWMGAIGIGKAPGIQMQHGKTEFAHDFSAIFASGPQLFDANVETLNQLGHPIVSLDYIIPHQVSGRLGQQAAKRLGVRLDQVFVNADRVGNTGSAAIWIALAELRTWPLKKGQRIAALGAEASKFMYGGFVYVHG